MKSGDPAGMIPKILSSGLSSPHLPDPGEFL
jgi:hypothetical protein